MENDAHFKMMFNFMSTVMKKSSKNTHKCKELNTILNVASILKYTEKKYCYKYT